MAKTATVGLRIDATLKSRLEQLAAADGRSLSNFIEQILLKAVADGQKGA
mgnify:FL=1|jgi:antitoxin component of RelBE/YafQ-DinJ toxin-antitoxin module